MRLKLGENTVQTDGGTMTNAKMGIRSQDMHVIINILRSKMYSNPIRTIIQEVGSNARDAHRELGIDRPIRIKLPDRHDNSFYIQDFGVGIDPDRMENVFINYGASTKRDTDDQTGGFGLGAKSPFSYTDQFGIICVTPDADGNLVLRQYAAIIEGHDGYVRQVEERPAKADEERGTKIVIPVKDQDFAAFRKWTIETCKYWETRPEVVSKVDKITWPEHDVEYEAKDKTWLIYEKEAHRYGYHHNNDSDFNSPKAIVDGIPYPLDKKSIEDSNDGDLNRDLNNLWGYPVLLKFKTGEVNLTANREELDYSDESTPVMIRKRFKGIITELQKKFGQDIKSCTNLIEANCRWNKLKKNYSNIVSSVKWNGIEVTGGSLGTNRTCTLTAFRRDSSVNDGISKGKAYQIDFSNENMLIAYDYGDSEGISRSKVGYLMDTHPNVSIIYVVKFSGPNNLHDGHDFFDKLKPAAVDAKRKNGTAKEVWEWWRDKHKVDKMIPVDLDATPRRKRKKRVGGGGGKGSGTPVAAIKTFKPNAYSVRERWIPCDKELADKGYIVFLHKFDAWVDPAHRHAISDYDLSTVADKLGITIHGVLKRYSEKITGWTPLVDYMKEQYAEYKQKFAAINGIDCKQSRSECSELKNIDNLTKAIQQMPKGSKCRDFMDKWEAMTKQADERKIYMNTCNSLAEILRKIDPDNAKKYPDVKTPKGSKDYFDVFKKRYPMLFVTQHWSMRRITVPDLKDYLTAMDDFLGDKHL